MVSRTKSNDSVSSNGSNTSLGLDTTGFGAASICEQRLYDVIQLAIICRPHRTMLLACCFPSEKWYFPFVTTKPGETASTALRGKIRELKRQLLLKKLDLSDGVLVDLMHIKVPPHNEFINRFTFRIELVPSKDNAGQCVCQKQIPKSFSWEQYDATEGFVSKHDKFGAVEPIILFNKTLNDWKEPVLQEITLEDMTKYLKILKDHPVNQLLTKLQLDEDHLYRCFLEYLHYTYPSIYMNKFTFEGWQNKSRILNNVYSIERLLASFQIDSSKKSSLSYIDFDEFLFGLLFLDSDCPQTSPFTEIKAGYIFRYYANGKKVIEYDDLLLLCKEMESVIKGCMVGRAELEQLKSKHIQEVDTFWKEAQLPAKGKGVGFNFTTFLSTATKRGKVSKYFDLSQMMKSQKQSRDQVNDWLVRSTHLGRNLVEIVRKRENICTKCDTRRFGKIADHQVRVLMNGETDELRDNSETLKNSINQSDKVRRRASKLFFSDDHFPNILLESIANYSEVCTEMQRKGKMIEAKDGRTDPYVWSKEFATKYMTNIIDLVRQTCPKPSNATTTSTLDTIKLESPCVAFSESRVLNLYEIEQRLSQMVPFCFPLRYIYLLSNDDNIQQCESLLGKESGSQLSTELNNLLNRLPRIALVDEIVHVVPCVPHSSDLKTKLASVMENNDKTKKEKNKAKSKVAVSEKKMKTGSKISTSSVKSTVSEKKMKTGSKISTSSVKSTVSEKKMKTGSKISNSSVKSSTSVKSVKSTTSTTSKNSVSIKENDNKVPSKETLTIFTTTDANKKLIYIMTPRDILIQLGKEKPSNNCTIVALIEAEKIRPLYLI
ncbi:hypothetical protein BLOT_007685 [Blomia tropicalis]|nr:hypothetical protein BLOT_007685 [Blomia tropicalis]